MAKLRKSIQFDANDEAEVKSAMEQVQKFCASGVAQGQALLTLDFEAPSLETRRGPRADGTNDDEQSEVPSPHRPRRVTEKAPS